jgi:hypothetical protein
MHGSQTPTAPLPPYLTPEASRAMRWAWVSLCLLPVSFVAAMILGDWLLTSQGYESGSEDVELGAVLKAGVPAMLVLVAPALASAWLGLKAKRLGHPDWLAPVLTAGVIAGASLALNLLQLFVALVQ